MDSNSPGMVGYLYVCIKQPLDRVTNIHLHTDCSASLCNNDIMYRNHTTTGTWTFSLVFLEIISSVMLRWHYIVIKTQFNICDFV